MHAIFKVGFWKPVQPLYVCMQAIDIWYTTTHGRNLVWLKCFGKYSTLAVESFPNLLSGTKIWVKQSLKGSISGWLCFLAFNALFNVEWAKVYR